MLPSVDGLTLCQRLEDERTSNIPILMITALGGLKDKVTGFNSGADDYYQNHLILKNYMFVLKLY